jgi:hypothetical protein
MFQHLLWHSPALIPIAIGASLLIVALVVWMYWPQMRRLRGPWKWILPSLRGIALVVLAISIVRPVVVRPRTPAERGAIVLLIDRSQSMGVVDAGRTPSELVALADGLQMLPRGARPKGAARLEAAPDALRAIVNDLFLIRGQLDYARISGQTTESAEQRLSDLAQRAQKLADALTDYPKASQLAQQLADLATQSDLPADQWTRQINQASDALAGAISRAQTSVDNDLYRLNSQVRQACDELGLMSRISIVNQALTSQETRVLPRLLSQAPVFGFEFADDVTVLPLEDDQGALRSLPLELGGTGTDLTGALRSVRERMQGQPIQAIVMLSDGQQVGPEGRFGQVLASSIAPVFTVSCAGPVRKEVAITRLQAPATAFVGQVATVRADIRGTGVNGSTIDVSLDADQKHQTQRVTLQDDRVATVEFAVRFEHPGQQNITISVAPLRDETSTDNNRIAQPINVVADKVKVLLLTGWPGWDFQYLRAALASSPFVEHREQVMLDESSRLTATPQDILKQDVIVLSDVRADSISPEQATAMSKLVREQGGSVLIIPGDPKNLVELSKLPGMAELLPFNDVEDAAWRVWPGEEPYFLLSVAPDAQDLDALKFSDDPATNNDRWNGLAGMFRFLPVTDPRASVLPLLVERDSELPVLTQMRVGTGRAFFWGARETWRWREKVGGRDQDQFWIQLIRYAARPRESAPSVEVTQDALAELANLSGDDNRLRRIAAATGGEMIRIEDVADLPDKIRSAGERLPGFFEYPIWDSGYLFAFVIGCFGVEWALRKRLGLV